MTLEDRFETAIMAPGDINEHLRTLRRYGSRVSHITEFGVRQGVSTLAWLAAKPDKLRCYDFAWYPEISTLAEIATEEEIDFLFFQANTLDCQIEETDLLFVDTTHTYEQLKAELERHAGKVGRYLAFHDTVTFPDMARALWEWLKEHPEWEVREQYQQQHGLTIHERNANAR